MPVLPDTNLEQIQFCESHIPIWTAAPAAVGLTAAQVTALDTQTKAARAAYTAAQNARQASKAATTTLHTGVKTMKSTVADMIKAIKSFAANSSNPGIVYAAAQIPPPAPPGTLPPPGQPTDISVGLNPDGSLKLRWRAVDAAPTSGVFFAISRRIGATGPYHSIGGASGGPRGISDFIDNTLALGTTQASYIIQGFRGTQSGLPSEAINIQLGVGGGPGLAVSGGATLAIAA